MKTPREILSRTVAVMAIAVRCVWEVDDSEGYKTPEELQPFIDKVNAWMEDKGYFSSMTEAEKTRMKTPVGVAPREQVAADTFSGDAIPVLLWVLGLGKLTERFQNQGYIFDFDPIEFLYDDHDAERILSRVKMRTKEEVEKMCNVAFLWHWRAVESRLNPKWHGDLRQVIHHTFGGAYDDCLPALALYEDRKNVDMRYGIYPIFELNRTNRNFFEAEAEMMHKALEWVLGDEDWDETPTDT